MLRIALIAQFLLTELPKYSDKYRPSLASQPTLKRKELHQPFFPPGLFEDFFNPKRRKTGMGRWLSQCRKLAHSFVNSRQKGVKTTDQSGRVGRGWRRPGTCCMLFPRVTSNSCLQEKSDAERSDVGSQPAESDYDVDEEYDNDYAENYFDNGEGDNDDDLGGGGGDEGGGGKLPTLSPSQLLLSCFLQGTTTIDPGRVKLVYEHTSMGELHQNLYLYSTCA